MQKVDVKPNNERLLESFIEMAKFDTGSNEEIAQTQVPSSEGQKIFAKFIAEKLERMGLREVNTDKRFVVTATLDSNMTEETPVVGFLAHMDTSPDAKSNGITPQIHNYMGGNIDLSDGMTISEEELSNFKGKTIITSDGTTLLGADDKAGIAAILEAVDILIENPKIKHPKIRIAITTDEETGVGADEFDIKAFGADVAYTLDGSSPNQLCIGNFTAYNPEITITGENYHPGHAFGKTNTIKVKNEIESKIPAKITCEKTQGKRGYIHIHEDKGTVCESYIKLLVRDFAPENVEKKLNLLEKIIEETQIKYPDITIKFEKKPVYFNMNEKLKEFLPVIQKGLNAIKQNGLTPEKVFARGGTDGAKLSSDGLLTPDIGVGMYNIHSPKEFAVLEEMSLTAKIVVSLAVEWGKNVEKIMPEINARRNKIF